MSIQDSTAIALEAAFSNLRKSNSPSDFTFTDHDRKVSLRSILIKGTLRIDYIQEGMDPYEDWRELNIHDVKDIRYYPDGKGKGRGALVVSSNIVTANVTVEPDPRTVCERYNLMRG